VPGRVSVGRGRPARPAVTAVLAYVFLGQSLGWLAIAGLAVSGAGVTLATRRPRSAAADRPATRPVKAPERSVVVAGQPRD
jgi:hypothetical protein